MMVLIKTLGHYKNSYFWKAHLPILTRVMTFHFGIFRDARKSDMIKKMIMTIHYKSCMAVLAQYTRE